MFKKLFFVLFILDSVFCAAPSPVMPQWGNLDVDSKREGWKVDLQRISLNFTSMQLSNQNLYESFSNNKIIGNSQSVIQAYMNFMVDYYSKSFVFFNSILAEYGQTTIAPKNEKRIINKTLDRLTFSTGYTQRLWSLKRFGSGELGPFIQLSYQTEMLPSLVLPYRKKFLRLNSGLRIFDGVYFKNIGITTFLEEDFSNPNNFARSFGLETSLNMKKKLREGVDLSGILNYRHYLINNYEKDKRPEYELEFNLRLDTKIWKDLTISPFISMYVIKGRYINVAGQNLFFGVSFGYGKVIKDNKKLVIEL